jgi:hypothetical protein
VSRAPEVVEFLEALLPYLIIKGPRALVLIEKLKALPSMQVVTRAT